MREAGVVITGLGLATVAVAGIMAGMSAAECEGGWIRCPEGEAGLVGLLFVMPIGGLISLIGAPLWIAGEWDVPVDPEEPESALAPAINLGPRGGSLSWSF